MSSSWKIPVLFSRSAPTITLQPGATDGKDVSLQADSPNTNNGTNTSCHAIMTGGSAARRAALQFDVSSIPLTATILSATLYLTCNSSKTAAQVNAHRITQAWTELGATWNKYDGVTDWASAGGDYHATIYASNNPASWVSGSVYAFDLTALVQAWTNGTYTNNGVLLKLATESGTNIGLQFNSSDNATPENRPRLVVTYA